MKNLFNQTYENHPVTFDFMNKNVMVNATEMASIFPNKRINDFLVNQSTKDFIKVCIKNGNSRFLNVEKKEDIVTSIQKSGTWMHRILALKFAAWLNPAFELWVYSTIDHILFGYYNELEDNLRKSAERDNEIESLEGKFMADPDFIRLKQLQIQQRQASYRRGKHNREQMNLFKQRFKVE